MALQCPVLMQSCLALSSKQLALKATGDEGRLRENIAIGYYRKAVKMIRSLLVDTQCARSDEILASSIILSTYEMFDVVGESFGSHLKGIAFFLQSRQVTGDASGIRGAAYWTWYRHEIWAALQTGRRMFLNESYWEPEPMESFNGLSVEDIANRAIFLFGQCVSFCNDDGLLPTAGRDERHNTHDHRAIALDAALENWKQRLPPSMSHFFAERPSDSNGSHEFPFIWFIYPQSAIGYQVYHASKILLTLHSPSILSESTGPARIQSLSNRRQIERSREQIFLISNAGVPDTWSLISTQCLFVAGMVTDGVLEREQTLRLIEQCQKSSGRRTVCLADELRKMWSQ
ncbi:hypothetical protein BDV40DRAFT_114140 [Aspergillus tamarii]|uniref:Transcription factor domain-containing protein n=1 Tax=Aspergillus tamarii TaxID=41984 RepID=A0A5N6V0K2_ASPTM|nr:hypothetical protein BDV40DRAFT_114140 [Aspergillus tamarii]